MNIHAAANDGDWGTDFNPRSAERAGGLAEASASALGCSTPRLRARRTPELPDFDIIGLHGIWTWISRGTAGSLLEIIADYREVRRPRLCELQLLAGTSAAGDVLCAA